MGEQHAGPYRAHLGEQEESRLEEQLPREGYRTDLNSSINCLTPPPQAP